MRQRTRETLLGAVSVALYLGGVVAFLVVAGRAWVAVDAHVAGEITALDFVLAGAGIALFAAARRVRPKLERGWSPDASEGIGGRRPEPSKLE